MIEFDVDMGYLLEAGELDRVVLNDENDEYEPMEFVPKQESELNPGGLTVSELMVDFDLDLY